MEPTYTITLTEKELNFLKDILPAERTEFRKLIAKCGEHSDAVDLFVDKILTSHSINLKLDYAELDEK